MSGKEGWEGVWEGASSRLNIPPLWRCCMSSCNQNLVIFPQSICSEASTRTSSPLLFLFDAKMVLGFLTRHLNLRLINALLNILHFFFSFLFFFCHSPKWSIVLSWTILSTLLCSLSASFSCLICLFRTSNSNTSYFKDWTCASSGRVVLGPAADCSKDSR